MRASIFFFFFAGLAACAGDDLPNADPPELHDIDQASAVMQEAAEAVVRIQHPAGTSGTGSFISADGLLLTNAHVLGGELCAREGCQVALTFQHQRGVVALPPRTAYAVPQHVDVGVDMAAVQIFMDESMTQRLPTPHFLSFEAHTAPELVGQRVTAIGHPLGRLKKWSAGYVVGSTGEWFESSVFGLPGSSGSPFVNDAGKLVGLLHRGADGFDLLTSTSAEVTATGSASAAVQRALQAALPSSVISVSDPLSADQALAYSSAFLAASKWTANVDGQPVSLAWLLGSDCDEGLAQEGYESLEALRSSIAPCFRAVRFLECRKDVLEQAETKPKECPSDRAQWVTRLQTVALKEAAFNGMLDLSAVSYAIEMLADSEDAAEQTGRTNMLQALDAAKPKLDFGIGQWLASYGVASWNGQSVVELVRQYEKQPFYERSGYEIASAAFWFYAHNLLPKEETLQIARALHRDGSVSLGAKLRIEELLYNAGVL